MIARDALLSAVATGKRDLAALRARLSQDEAQLRSLEHQVQQLRDQCEVASDECDLLVTEIGEAEDLLALLSERQVPDPGSRSPEDLIVPDVIPEPDRPETETLREVREIIRERHDAERRAVTHRTRSRTSRSPLTVNAQAHHNKAAGHGAGSDRTPIYERTEMTAGQAAKVSATTRERTDLLCLVLEAGAMSQADLAVEMADLMGAKLPTARSIVSECLALAQHERRVLWTGLKVPAKPGNRRHDSPVWKLRVSADDHASAGIASDDEADPKTTAWPNAATTPGLGRVTVEPGNYEGGKR